MNVFTKKYMPVCFLCLAVLLMIFSGCDAGKKSANNGNNNSTTISSTADTDMVAEESVTPGSTGMPDGTVTPMVSVTPGNSVTPANSATPSATKTPAATKTPGATAMPKSSPQVKITPTPTVKPTATKATTTPQANLSSQAGDLPAHVLQLMQNAVGNLNPHPTVGLVKGTDHAKLTREAIENAGGLTNIIEKGDTVLIKPNLVWPVPGDSGTTTDYRIVAEIVKMVKECGASKVYIGEGTAQKGVYEGTMMNLIEGVEYIDFNKFGKEECYYLKPSNSQAGVAFYIPKIYMDVDKVIDVPKMKVHNEAVVTLCLKNCSIGVPPTPLYTTLEYAYKYQLHLYGLPNSIVDICQIRKPDFCVIDGIIGMAETGPIGGKPIHSNVVIAGSDPVAVDTVGLTFMGFTVDEVPHVQLATKVGLGVNKLEDIHIVGEDVNAITMNFKKK